ncbi:MAG TPA: hypothetical protein VFE34_03975 [Dongiaceae bacterium]|jgi:hypothetical protein|nr:hypothetical protein [Dongiaceae bacterium]
MRRTILWIIALATLANGGVMMLAAENWWALVLGVADTGAFNAHFVRDVGAAYAAAGLGLAWFAARPRERAAALVALTFLGLHALFHVVEFAEGHGGGGVTAILAVIAPTVIAALAILWPRSKIYATGEV